MVMKLPCLNRCFSTSEGDKYRSNESHEEKDNDYEQWDDPDHERFRMVEMTFRVSDQAELREFAKEVADFFVVPMSHGRHYHLYDSQGDKVAENY